MEKTKEQILMEKVRRLARKGMPPMDGRPPMGGRPPMHGQPGFEERAGRDCRPPMHGQPGFEERAGGHGCRPMRGRPPFGGRPPFEDREGHGNPPPMNPPMGRPPMGPGPMGRERILTAVMELGEDGVRQKDIAEAVGINASSLSEQLDRLEGDRYIERKVNPDDRRSTLIALTEKGKARAWEAQDERQQAAAAFCANLTEEEKDQLIALLDKLMG